MKNKYLNEAIIGNKNIVASFSSKGELLRLLYPNRDFKQFVDTMHFGVKVNDSRLIYLHDDINNVYNQYYTKNTNILNTEIENKYFNLQVTQTDFVCIKEDLLIKKYVLKNNNSIDLDINFLLYSNLLSNYNNMVGSKVEKDILMQYSHDYTISIFSNIPILSYRLNNSKEEIKEGILKDKDYIGMANDTAVSFNLKTLKPGESKEINIFITIDDNSKIKNINDIEKKISQYKKTNVKKELKEVEKYWDGYVKDHDGLKIFSKQNLWQKVLKYSNEQFKRLIEIYTRSILLFPLLVNQETGGIVAALEVDEEKDNCGRYSYCWPRDGVFINKALNILGINDIVEKFYTAFSKQTQNENGMWEQRFYTDGRLAPCWGYQIDETASVVFGVYSHYHKTKDEKFLKEVMPMCEKAIKFLKKYMDYIISKRINIENVIKEEVCFETHESYDLWEMNEGVHLYSLSAIYAAFTVMAKMCQEVGKKEREVQEIKQYAVKIKEFCMNYFYDENAKILRRNNKDWIADISVLGAVTPFRMLDPNQKEVKNTVEKLDLTLRTYTGGYLRFENDNYFGGKNPWTIATLWMALYQLQVGEKEKAIEAIEFVTKTATKHGFLAEQIDNETMSSKWVIGLGWSHAMYITTLYSFALKENLIGHIGDIGDAS